MNINKLDSCGSESRAQKFTKLLRAALGGRNIALRGENSTAVPMIRHLSHRILASIPLFTVGLPYTIPAAMVLLKTPMSQIYPPIRIEELEIETEQEPLEIEKEKEPTELSLVERLLTVDVWNVICSQELELSDLNSLSRTSKTLHKKLKPILERVWVLTREKQIFGRREWLTIPGVYDVSEEPPLSLESLDKELKKNCPFFNAKDKIRPHRFQGTDKIKKTWQTQLTLLIPETINGTPVTVDLLGKIFSFLKKGEYENLFAQISGKKGVGFRSEEVSESYWIRITRDLIPHSRNKKLKHNEKLLKEKGYRFPHVIEAIAAISVMNIKPNWHFDFGKDEANLTLTQTSDNDLNAGIIVGGGKKNIGLHVQRLNWVSDQVGVAAVATIPSTPLIKPFAPQIFGKREWLNILGIEVGEEPPLNMDSVEKELNDLCPFFNEEDTLKQHRFQNDRIKRVWETQMYVLIPETIEGELITPKLLKQVFGSVGLDVPYFMEVPKSHWIRITKDVVPNSRKKTYKEQVKLLQSKGYRPPTLLEAIIAISIMNIGPSQRHSGYFFGKDPVRTLCGKVKSWGERVYVPTYTRTIKDHPHLTFSYGAVSPEGANLRNDSVDDDGVGIAAVLDLR